MAAPGGSPKRVEERSVKLAEVEAGIQLRPGHPVVLIVDGLHGRPDLQKHDYTSDPAALTATGPGQPESPTRPGASGAAGEAPGARPSISGVLEGPAGR